MNKDRRRYLSYLLRLWQTDDGETQVWRASLDSPGTRERQGFASLEELFSFLEGQTRSQSEQGSGDKSREKTGRDRMAE
jgi:hypothetical protein